MDFTLSEDQELLRESARNLLTKECPPSLVRAHMEDPSAADGLWKHLAEWTELGQGPLVDLCLFLEELGAVIAPGPFFATTALYAGLGLDGLGTIAFVDDPTIPFALEVDRVDKVAFVDTAGFHVHDASDVDATFVETIDSTRRHFQVRSPAWFGYKTEVDVAALRERAYVALAAEMVGTARWMLQATIDYAKQREQFGRPIGSFQAVKHKLADMALTSERAWSAVYYAAMAIDADDPDRHRAAHVAKVAAGDAAKLCAKDGVQIHGGVGFTWEHDLHLYIRRAYGDEHLLGTTEWHLDRLAALVLH